MAGNPDQQEDNVDEQYQEEGEEEVGRGRAGGQTAWGLTHLKKPLRMGFHRKVQRAVGWVRKDGFEEKWTIAMETFVWKITKTG